MYLHLILAHFKGQGQDVSEYKYEKFDKTEPCCILPYVSVSATRSCLDFNVAVTMLQSAVGAQVLSGQSADAVRHPHGDDTHVAQSSHRPRTRPLRRRRQPWRRRDVVADRSRRDRSALRRRAGLRVRRRPSGRRRRTLVAASLGGRRIFRRVRRRGVLVARRLEH